MQREKEDTRPSPMKTPISTENKKTPKATTHNATKTSITQQLLTDLERSVGVTTSTAFQLVWLIRSRGSFPISYVIKRHI